MRQGQGFFLAGLAIFGLAMACPTPAPAAEPAHLAVMGVRLEMSAQEVLTTLYAQGVHEDAVVEHVHPCALHQAASCTDSITARLADGPISIRFTDAPAGFNDGREAAFSIAYRVTSGSSSGSSVREVAEERFGRLAGGADQFWCAPAAAAGGGCPADHPRMSFARGADGAAR